MSNVSGFQCVECNRRFLPGDVRFVCPRCSGNLDVLYDYERVALTLTKSALVADRNHTMWRYRALLPIEDGSSLPPLATGWTPVYESRKLADRCHIRRLLLKDEGRNPTGSLKDRPSALAVVKACESGAETITTASSGNAGSALAGMCASVGMKSVIFVPAAAPPAKVTQLQVYGAAVVLVDGSYDDAYDLCLKAADQNNWYQRSTGYNPFMTEGKKTSALEIAEQLGWETPDRIFVGVGDGCIIGGLWKGFTDLYRIGFIDRLPKLVGVQSDTASAIVDAVNSDGVVRAGPAQTVADSICVSQPRDATKAIRAIRESGGAAVKVGDDEIIASITLLSRETGVFAEPAAAASLAGLVRMSERGEIPAGETVLVVLTGNGLKDIGASRRALSDPLKVRPGIGIDELNSLISGL